MHSKNYFMESMSDKEFSPPEKIRRFDRDAELLPLKVDGQLVRRFKPKVPDVKDEIKEEAASICSDVPAQVEEDTLENLSVHDLLAKQKMLLNESKLEVSTLSNTLISDPQENIGKLKELLKLCVGDDVDVLVQEFIQKLAIASLAEVFVSIIPGYQIRELTAEEQKQKMKADTRKLLQFEEALVNNYQKYLSLLEENATKLLKSKVVDDDDVAFITKLGFLSMRCLCKLLNNVSHFNFASNIISCLVRLGISSNEEITSEVCAALSQTFKDDVSLSISLHGVKTISDLVNSKKGHVAPAILSTFLSLNIKEINRSTAEAKNKTIRKQPEVRISKQVRKQNKRNKKVEDPLREAEASEKLSVKLKLATEIMKYVFMTYFRILKRMPNTAILSPVLEGLAKFAHLINVEFFEDLVHSLSSLVDQKHLKLSDSLRCIKTVCVVLAGEGQVLNIDPLKFYNTLYSLLPSLVFQENSVLTEQAGLLVDCLDMLLVKRRKVISLKRVAAFVKRILLICILLPVKHCVCLLAMVRSIFVAHPGLGILVDDGDEEAVANGIFQADANDPDCSNSLSTDLIEELKLLSKHPDRIVSSFARNILNRIPSTGSFRLSAQWTNMPAQDWLLDENEHLQENKNADSPFKKNLKNFCGRKKVAMTSKNVCSTLRLYLEQSCK